MKLRITLLVGIALFVFLGAVPSAGAESQQWSVGGGYWTLPNVDSEGGTIGTSGMYAAGRILTREYMLEVDYSFDDTGFLIIAADYLYPLNDAGTFVGGNGYIGGGYTYFSSDELQNESGFNVVACATLGDALFGVIRYDFLGSNQELFTIGVTYSFY